MSQSRDYSKHDEFSNNSPRKQADIYYEAGMGEEPDQHNSDIDDYADEIDSQGEAAQDNSPKTKKEF